jgi:hypothetical protein
MASSSPGFPERSMFETEILSACSFPSNICAVFFYRGANDHCLHQMDVLKKSRKRWEPPWQGKRELLDQGA